MGNFDFFKNKATSPSEVNLSEDVQVKYTPECINTLAPNEVFVFGSNLRGWHQGGAAKHAQRYFGAIWGQGVGLQGQSYAIPTMPVHGEMQRSLGCFYETCITQGHIKEKD